MTEKKAVFCPKCGRLVSVDQNHCPWCGQERPGARFRLSTLFAHLQKPGGILKVILIANVVFYLLSLFLNPAGAKWSLNPFTALSPDSRSLLMLGATGTIPLSYNGSFWTVITAGFLHGGLLHILFNMAALQQVGALAEKAYGPFRMLLIYLVTGPVGFIVSIFGGVRLTIGASASLCGLIGALLYYGKRRGGFHGKAVYRETMGWVVGLVLFGLFLPGINNWGHGGGLVSGLLLAPLLDFTFRKQEGSLHKWAALFLFALTLGLLIWIGLTAVAYRLGLERLI